MHGASRIRQVSSSINCTNQSPRSETPDPVDLRRHHTCACFFMVCFNVRSAYYIATRLAISNSPLVRFLPEPKEPSEIQVMLEMCLPKTWNGYQRIGTQIYIGHHIGSRLSSNARL